MAKIGHPCFKNLHVWRLNQNILKFIFIVILTVIKNFHENTTQYIVKKIW